MFYINGDLLTKIAAVLRVYCVAPASLFLERLRYYPVFFTFVTALLLQLCFLPCYVYLFSKKKFTKLGIVIVAFISLLSIFCVIVMGDSIRFLSYQPSYFGGLAVGFVQTSINALIHFYSTRHNYEKSIVSFGVSFLIVFLPSFYFLSKLSFLQVFFVLCLCLNSWIIKFVLYYFGRGSLYVS